jgi:hypothetical protein
MSCTSLNCSELPDYEPNDCNLVLLGGSDQIILFECGSNVTDPSNATQIQAAINAGTAKLIQNVKFGIPAPTAVDLPVTVSGQPPRVGTYDHTATLYDANVNAVTMPFYNAVGKGRDIEAILAYMNSEETPTVRWIAPPGSIFAKGGYVSPDDSTDVQRFEFTFSWKDQKPNPELATTPAGIFD